MFDFLSPAWIQDLIQTYGLWVLFCVVLLESMGLPVPGEIALVTTALYSGSTHKIGIVAVVAVAAGAGILGYNLAYLIGRSLGLRLIARYGERIGLHEGRVRVGQYLFFRHGGKIVFVGRLIPFLRPFVALLAGAELMRWRLFLVMNSWVGFAGHRSLASAPISLESGSGISPDPPAFYWPQAPLFSLFLLLCFTGSTKKRSKRAPMPLSERNEQPCKIIASMVL